MAPLPVDGLKIETTDETLTAHADLPLVSSLFEALGLRERVNTALASLKQRGRGYSSADFVRPLLLLHVAGGDCLDDIRLLDGDRGLRTLLGESGFRAANTLGSFVHAFGHHTTTTKLDAVVRPYPRLDATRPDASTIRHVNTSTTPGKTPRYGR